MSKCPEFVKIAGVRVEKKLINDLKSILRLTVQFQLYCVMACSLRKSHDCLPSYIPLMLFNLTGLPLSCESLVTLNFVTNLSLYC